MINDSIKASKLHVIRKKEDFTFKSYILRVLKFWLFIKILNHSWVAFFSETPCRNTHGFHFALGFSSCPVLLGCFILSQHGGISHLAWDDFLHVSRNRRGSPPFQGEIDVNTHVIMISHLFCFVIW